MRLVRRSMLTNGAVRGSGGVYKVRNLPQLPSSIREPAHSDRLRPIVEDNLGKPAFPVRGTLFDKTVEANWLVPWHQDLTICVASRASVPGCGPWAVKAGVCQVHPPRVDSGGHGSVLRAVT
ncbi:MAG TPA: hypothetical protein VGG72_10145 [Bryobacteraceae bacterium]